MLTLTKGTILEDTYEIIEEIGSGGGGIIFKARHLRLQTDVVVKKIKDEVKEKINLRQEADILKKLKHPYLPRVYDFIQTEDGVYTVMDFIHGEDLESAVKRRGKFSQKQVRKWAEQLGEALNYLHSQNPPIIHSDIKPANIMLTEDGDICLIDFNISLAMGNDMESAVGISAGFSPPEQYRDPALYARITHNYTLQKSLQLTQGESLSSNVSPETDYDKTELLTSNDDDKTELLTPDDDYEKTELLSETPVAGQTSAPLSSLPKYTQYIGRGVDSRSDIYSLGVTLRFLLTGALPSLDFSQRVSVSETNTVISEGFAIIIDKMMALDPKERYKDGTEYLKAIRDCHKLDHRYIAMHRKQTLLQFAALASMAAGILLIFGGMTMIRAEKNALYYGLIQEAEEAMAYSDFETARSLITEARTSDESRIESFEKEVYLLYLYGDYDNAIDTGEAYINTVPFNLKSSADEESFGNIYYIIANAYFEKGDYANALNIFEHAFEYNNKNGLYYRDYAITLAKLGQIGAAEEQLAKGIELGIAQDSIYMAQGEIAHVKGEYDNAIEYLGQTISSTTDMQMKKRAILQCVDVYKTIGNSAIEQEIALLEQYTGQFEGHGNLVMQEYLAEAYTRKAQTDESIASECYDKALSLFQSIYDSGYITYQLQQNMAILYQNMDQFEDARTLLLRMAEDYPKRYEVYKRLAYLEADQQQMKDNIDRDYNRMLDYYEKAKELYTADTQDMEMDMLDNMMQDLKDGGWF